MSKYNVAHQLGSKPRTNDVLLPEGENIDFGSMLLPPIILRGLHSAGFVKPSPIQVKAIPLARCGFDLIVQAKSGTGKTCVFAVTALEHVVFGSDRLQAIVLAPTREIAQQIQNVISTIGHYQKNLKCKAFIGGVPIQEDMINVVNCQIAVGAPGRLRHLIEEKHLSLDAVRLVVLDEADKLMEESFQKDINFMFQNLPESKQVIACSATYTQDLLNFLGNYMQSATHVTPGEDPSPILIGLRHLVCIEPGLRNNLSKLKSKEACLVKILKNVSFVQCLIFSNYHSRAESICNGLRRNGWTALWIAGKQNQSTRTAVMANVKDLKVRILVTTDLTARGIDLHEVNLVINMDIPSDHHTYLHRMGRAGRYGGHGLVITILTEDEVIKFRRLLGAIGGSYASAFLIPDGKPTDKLWSCNVSTLEQIIGSQDDTDYLNDDSDEEEGELREIDGSADMDAKIKECKKENDVKIEVESMDNVGTEFMRRDNNFTNKEIIEIKDETDDFDDKIKTESNADVKNFSLDSDDSERESRQSNLSDDDNSDDPEKYSDSDGNDGSMNENCNEDEIEEDAESKAEYLEAMSKFGLKLLKYSYSNNLSDLRSYSKLNESLSSFIDNKNDIENLGTKKLLEPSGTIDIEFVEKFSNKLKYDFIKLINQARDIDTNLIIKWLLTGESFGEGFDCSKKKEDDKVIAGSSLKTKDPEYFSQSSSLSDNDSDDKLLSDDDDDSGSPKKVGFKNKDKYAELKSNEIESRLNKINLKTSQKGDNLYKTNFDGNHAQKNKKSTKELDNEVCDKTVLFLRKNKSQRKRKQASSVSSRSSQSSSERKSTYENVKSVSDKHFKKVKQHVSDEIHGKKVSKCSKNHSDQSNVNPFHYESNNASYSSISYQSVGTNHFNGTYQNQYPNSNLNYPYGTLNARQGGYPINQNYQNSSINHGNMSNIPKEVQDWYNLWYRQTANIRWYVGYSQYMNSMLNPKK